jgi:hypothetical protein
VPRPNLFELPLWEEFEQRVIEVFSEGLTALALIPRLPSQEDFISRELHKCCRAVNHRLRKLDRGVEYVLPQLTNLPLADDEYRARRLDKRPDFACGFHDDSLPEDQFEEADYHYTIECKRLGAPTSPTWVLNRNYITDGIARFDHPDWGYAAGTSSGLMIGFIQSMEPETILAEVNSHISPFPALSVSASGWVNKALSVLSPQKFDRRISIIPFTLNHFWVDLRHCEFFEVPDPSKKGRKRKTQDPEKQLKAKRSKKTARDSNNRIPI